MNKNSKVILLSFLKSVFRNSTPIFLSKSVLSISFFLLAILIVRRLGLTEFGKYSICISLYSIFELVSFLGLDNFILREVSKDLSQASKFLSQGLILGIFSTAFFYLATLLISNLMFYPSEIKSIIYVLSIALFPAYINTLCEVLFISVQKAKYVFYVSLVREIFLLLLSIMFLFIFHSLYLVMLAIIISRIIGGLLYFYFLAKIGIKASLGIDPVFFKNICKVIPTFVLISIFSTIFLEADMLILSKTTAIADVGIYGIAKRILRMMFIFTYSIITALFPVISHSYHVSKWQFLSLFRTSFKNIFFLSSSLVVIALLFSPCFISIFFGKDFIHSVSVTRVLVFSIVPLSLIFLFSRFLIVANCQRQDLLALVIGLVSIVLLGISMSLSWGYIGMSIAVVISTVILFSAQYLFVQADVIKPTLIHLREQ